jgi:hypothetical protein
LRHKILLARFAYYTEFRPSVTIVSQPWQRQLLSPAPRGAAARQLRDDLLDHPAESSLNTAGQPSVPWDAESYGVARKAVPQMHTLRNYMLFSVDADNTIAKPKQYSEQEQQ